MTSVQEWTVPRLGCSWSSVSAGQQKTGEEAQSCFGTVQSNLVKCECTPIHNRAPARVTFPVLQLSMEVQFSLAHHIQAMVKSERNRQVMCEGRLVSTLLTHCQHMLMAPNHPLHLPVTRILEKLSSQAITRADFRWNSQSLRFTHAFITEYTIFCRWHLFVTFYSSESSCV